MALEQLSEQRAFLHQIRFEGGSAEFFMGWFFEGPRGDVLPHDLLTRVADLKIDLSFDVYPLFSAENEQSEQAR